MIICADCLAWLSEEEADYELKDDINKLFDTNVVIMSTGEAVRKMRKTNPGYSWTNEEALVEFMNKHWAWFSGEVGPAYQHLVAKFGRRIDD